MGWKKSSVRVNFDVRAIWRLYHFVNFVCAALWQRVDVDEGPRHLLDPVRPRTTDWHRLLQALRSTMPEVHAGNLRTLHVVPGGGRQSKIIDSVLSTDVFISVHTPDCLRKLPVQGLSSTLAVLAKWSV